MRINFRFRFWSRGHLRVVVLHLYTAFNANIFIQYGDISILQNSLWPPSAILDLFGKVVGKWPLREKNGENFFEKFRPNIDLRVAATRGHILWHQSVMLGSWRTRTWYRIPDKKTLLRQNCSNSRFCLHLADRAQNLLNVMDPSPVHVPNLVRIGCGLLELFPTDWFVGPRTHYSIGWKPTWLSAYNKDDSLWRLWWTRDAVSKPGCRPDRV